VEVSANDKKLLLNAQKILVEPEKVSSSEF
jgi:hypothetical protein